MSKDSKLWSWEQFSADFAGDDDYKDLSSVSSPFRQLLGELASQHLSELAQIQREVAVQSRRAEAWREQLERGGNKWPDPIAPTPAQSQLVPAPVSAPTFSQPAGQSNPAEDEEEVGYPRAKGAKMQSMRISVSKEAHMIEDMQFDEEEEILMPQDSASPWQRFSAFMKGGTSEMIIGVLILMNVVTMGFQLQYKGFDVGQSIGFYDFSAEDVWPSGGRVFFIIEGIFTILFAVELLARILVLKWDFVKVAWNWLDAFVVVTSLLQMAWSGMLNTTVLRLLRIAKLGRGVRVVKMSTVLDSLRMILKCITASFLTLFWSLFLLFVIQCIGAMTLMYGIDSYLEDENMPHDGRMIVFKYYGTFTRTMLTMFEVLFANWISPCRVLVDHVSEWFSLVFIMYRCLVGFAVLNVVNAVFVQQTMKVAQNDQEFIIMQKQKAMRSLTTKLKLLFQDLDTSGDGLLTWEEFSVVLTDEKMSALLSSMEIETQDLKSLFELLDSGDGHIDAEEFASGVLAIKGPAKSLDVAQLKHNQKDILKALDKILRGQQESASDPRMPSSGPPTSPPAPR
mmetsp:Transcript_93379/g.166084  ORF Transcript_93379/g.166084 Transcript_93379/m.166084 type:complete len:566 (+) Transcript_93379:43-1740(+)